MAGRGIGAAIGTAILPGIGTAVGGFLGGLVGSHEGGKIEEHLTGGDKPAEATAAPAAASYVPQAGSSFAQGQQFASSFAAPPNPNLNAQQFGAYNPASGSEFQQ